MPIETSALAEYVETWKECDQKAYLTVKSFSRLGGYETKIEDIIRVSEELQRTLREDDVDGIVVVMGTNVMEEAAFAIRLLVQTEAPIVFTGAMRIPQARSAAAASETGPCNVLRYRACFSHLLKG